MRLLGLGVAIAIAFLGFVPVLVDDRRRALQDFLAGTTVYYDELAPLPDGRGGRRRRRRASHRHDLAACAGSIPGCCSARGRPGC